jgi:hypothetical protein
MRRPPLAPPNAASNRRQRSANARSSAASWGTKTGRELLAHAGRNAYLLRYRIDEDAVGNARVWHSRKDR